MLTEEGYKRRFWGPLETLRKLLDGKRIPDSYYGPTSVSDNAFDAVSRHLQLSVLVRENKDTIAHAVSADPGVVRPLLDELQELRSMLRAESDRFRYESSAVEDILESVYRCASQRERDETNSEDFRAERSAKEDGCMTSVPGPAVPTDSSVKPLSADEQVSHQHLDDSKRLSIQIDCPPGNPRPPEVFASTIQDTDLTAEDFVDPGVTFFGCQEYLVKANPESISRYLRARQTIGERLCSMYEHGIVRGVTW